MNKNIFIVLFAISAILNIYLFATKEKKTAETTVYPTENQLSSSISANEKNILLDSIRKLVIEKSDLQYFDLQYNGYAKDYFLEMGIENPEELVTAAILQTNTLKRQHPLIRFAPKNTNFQTNKIKIINHKWAICDFSDGTLWGELLLKYHINEDKKVELTVIDDLLYPEEDK
ncbi:MAG: hydrolase [Capnocytophaga sp.]|nr:hydrolase [Capnocytophaga sp.]